MAVMNKLVKQRKESILSYTEGNRPDLAVAEQAECDVIYSYLPKQLTTEEVGKMITEAIAKVAATNIKDMGKVRFRCSPFILSISSFHLISSFSSLMQFAYKGNGGAEAFTNGQS